MSEGNLRRLSELALIAIASIWGLTFVMVKDAIEELPVWSALIVTSLIASALGFFVQSFAQQHAPPARTALILAAEPAFAGLFGLAPERRAAECVRLARGGVHHDRDRRGGDHPPLSAAQAAPRGVAT